jgi:hypothetical protein
MRRETLNRVGKSAVKGKAYGLGALEARNRSFLLVTLEKCMHFKCNGEMTFIGPCV